MGGGSRYARGRNRRSDGDPRRAVYREYAAPWRDDLGADHDGAGPFDIEGVEKALAIKNADIRIFGKPNLKPYRRVAVALGPDRETAKTIAQTLRIVPTSAS